MIPNDVKTVSQNILDILNALEHILQAAHLQAIIFIDEFQEILETKLGKSIEGAIRHFAQESEQVIFIFSGSNRRMLKKMFNDRSRPLYSLCDEIKLGRIDSSYYQAYIKKISEKTYGKILSDKIIEQILYCSDRHPKYVYLLCSEIWFRCTRRLPTLSDVNSAWQELVIQRLKDVRMELTNRPPTQLKLLTEIAKGNDSHLSSKQQSQLLNMTSSSIVQALKVLEELDYIERIGKSKYRMIDPLIKECLQYAHST